MFLKDKPDPNFLSSYFSTAVLIHVFAFQLYSNKWKNRFESIPV